MYRIKFINKPLRIFLIILVFFLSSCGILDISIEYKTDDASETPLASSTSTVFVQSTAPLQTEFASGITATPSDMDEPDHSSSFPTYTSIAGHFSVGVPLGFTLMEGQKPSVDGVIVSIPNAISLRDDAKGRLLITIIYTEIGESVSLSDFLLEASPCVMDYQRESVIVDETQAFLFRETPCGPWGLSLYALVKGGYGYLIEIESHEVFEDLMDILNPFIATFRVVPTSANPHPPTASPSTPGAPSHYEPISIDTIHMVDETHGWSITNRTVGEYTYRTILYSEDGGYTWRDMNDLGEGSYLMTPRAVGFFLDEHTGWTADYYDLGEEPGRNIITFMRWFNQSACETEESSMVGTVYSPGVGVDSELFLDFVHCDRGWFMFNTFVGAGHHVHDLYSSYDGGVSWVPMMDTAESLCSKTGMDFIDENNGWITSSCPFDPGNVLLERTEDGGLSWLSLHLPPPESSPTAFTDALSCTTSFPTLFSAKSGFLLVTCYFQNSNESFLYMTDNGGETWSTKTFPGEVPYFIRQDVGWALSKDIYQTFDGGSTWSLMSKVDWDGQYNFVNDQVGWSVARLGEKTQLVYTNDGGRTWSMIEPLLIIPS